MLRYAFLLVLLLAFLAPESDAHGWWGRGRGPRGGGGGRFGGSRNVTYLNAPTATDSASCTALFMVPGATIMTQPPFNSNTFLTVIPLLSYH